MCIYLNLMILIKIIRGFISAWQAAYGRGNCSRYSGPCQYIHKVNI
ncbi:hypothetical protein ABQ24_003973 [Salmonella enterica subsp. enterica]|nr:hypothetical protein [Salmonella enterica subsp. enterica serovar Panama]